MFLYFSYKSRGPPSFSAIETNDSAQKKKEEKGVLSIGSRMSLAPAYSIWEKV